ncbi:hypothetical protein D3C83_316410 [compost metagenome]
MSTATSSATVWDVSRKKTPMEARNQLMPRAKRTTGRITSGKSSTVGWIVRWITITNASSTR